MESHVKTGLVLEGGGMRGIYTAGVLDVFMDNGITFDGVIGVSAGAIHGCSFVSGQRGRNIRYYKKYCNDKRFMSWRNLIFTGDIAGRQFCYYDLPKVLDPYDYDAFNRAETEFYVTCSNLDTGKAEYLKITDMDAQIELLRASASLPYVSRIVRVDGMKLLDGGCTDSIPLRAFGKMGFRRNVVVLTRQEGYRKEPERTALAGIVYHRYPRFVKAVKRRHLVYNRTLEDIERLEQAGRIFVIRPSVSPMLDRISRDARELQRVYDLGMEDAKNCLDQMVKWLQSSKPLPEGVE